MRPTNFHLAASREYLKRKGTPLSPEDLEQHDFVAVGSGSSLSFVGPNGRFEVPMRVVLRYRSSGGVANAVAAGLGLAPVPAIMFEDPHFKARDMLLEHEDPLARAAHFAVMIAASVAIPFHRLASRRFSLSVCWLSS